MCRLTAVTIVYLMLFIADLDDITRGVFVVDLSTVGTAFLKANRHVIYYGGDVSGWHTAPDVTARLEQEYLDAGMEKPASWQPVWADLAADGQ